MIGRDKLFDLLRDKRLLITPRRSYQKTTLRHHRFRRHLNLLKQGVKPERPEQVWVADITYLPPRESEGYLSLVSDSCSCKIVGYPLDDNMKTATVAKALRMALKQRKSDQTLIHHWIVAPNTATENIRRYMNATGYAAQ